MKSFIKIPPEIQFLLNHRAPGQNLVLGHWCHVLVSPVARERKKKSPHSGGQICLHVRSPLSNHLHVSWVSWRLGCTEKLKVAVFWKVLAKVCCAFTMAICTFQDHFCDFVLDKLADIFNVNFQCIHFIQYHLPNRQLLATLSAQCWQFDDLLTMRPSPPPPVCAYEFGRGGWLGNS